MNEGSEQSILFYSSKGDNLDFRSRAAYLITWWIEWGCLKWYIWRLF